MHRVEYTLTADDLLTHASELSRKYGTWASYPKVTAFNIAMGCAFIGAVMVGIPLVIAGQPVPILYWGFFALIPVELIAFWFWARGRPVRDMRMWLANGDTRDALAPQIVEFEPDGFTVHHRSGSTTAAWHVVVKVEHTPGFLCLHLGNHGGIIIPLRVLESEEERLQLIADVLEYRKAAPPAELSCPKCRYDLRGTTLDRCPECGWRRDQVTCSAATSE